MKKEYLSEAFRQLELLNEEDFNLSTTADNSDLKDFLDNDDMSVMSLDVIDPEAETEEDLEDSYTGKVILDCCVCHSKLYKDKEEVTVDEEEDLANTDEECPFCYSRDGFKIIGEVAPYGETEEETEGAEDDKSLELDSEKETEIDESIRKGLELKEGFMGQTLDDFLGDWNNAENISIWCYDENEDGPVFEGDVSDIPDKYLNAQFDDFDTEGKIYVNVSDVDDDFDESLKESTLSSVAANLKARRNSSEPVNEAEDGRKLFTEYKILVDGRTYEISHTKQRADEIVPILKDMYPDSEIEAKPYKHYASGIERKRLERQIADQLKGYGVNESVNESNDELSKIKLNAKKAALRDGYDQVIYIDDDGEYGIRRYRNGLKPRNDEKFVFIVKIYYDKGIQKVKVEKFPEIEESLDESIQEIEIETDTDKIKIESEPKEESGETEDVLAPVSPETEQQIENNSSDEIDVPIDEFDEETFDELGESFLKNTYENVKGYKTESIKEQDGNKLVVEGLITFNSGKVKKTLFIFEAKDITKSGKVRFIGENCQLSRGKKSFTVAGKIQEGKFISESLNYNYRAKDANTGKSTRMYGTVRTSK